MRIVLTGGGTGGHIFPILAVIREIRKQLGEKRDVDFLFIGPGGELEREVMAKELIPARKILCGKLRRYFSFRNLVDIFKIPIGLAQSLWYLLVFMPDAVFAKGGYASVTVVAAAWLYRIPVVIHESDVTPGLANQLMSRMARRIAVSFSGSEKFFPERKVLLTGNPIRVELAQGDMAEARRIFSLNSERKTILVMGGSQGARSINQAILRILPKILKKYQLIHITGKVDYEDIIHEAGKLGIKAGREGYHPYPFLHEELKHALAVSDLVISRAGANAMTEIAANAKPAIIIPIADSANNHQEQNAFAFSQAGAAVMLEQNNLGENILLGEIERTIESRELSFELSERVKKFYNPKAAEIIAREIIEIAV